MFADETEEVVSEAQGGTGSNAIVGTQEPLVRVQYLSFAGVPNAPSIGSMGSDGSPVDLPSSVESGRAPQNRRTDDEKSMDDEETMDDGGSVSSVKFVPRSTAIPKKPETTTQGQLFSLFGIVSSSTFELALPNVDNRGSTVYSSDKSVGTRTHSFNVNLPGEGPGIPAGTMEITCRFNAGHGREGAAEKFWSSTSWLNVEQAGLTDEVALTVGELDLIHASPNDIRNPGDLGKRLEVVYNPDGSYKCERCQKTFSSGSDMLEHKRRASYEWIRCDKCPGNVMFATVDGARKHAAQHELSENELDLECDARDPLQPCQPRDGPALALTIVC